MQKSRYYGCLRCDCICIIISNVESTYCPACGAGVCEFKEIDYKELRKLQQVK